MFHVVYWLGKIAQEEVENNKQIVDEPAVKETKHLESDSKAVMTSFSEYYGISGSFIHGFIATFCMIIVSELGDKTFFIARFDTL